jgi:hypothetical protein
VTAKIKRIPLSSDTIRRRAEDIRCDIKEQVLDAVKNNCWYALQIDESTNITNEAQLMVYAHYVDKDSSDIVESFLFCKPIGEHATGSSIFDCIRTYFCEKKIP